MSEVEKHISINSEIRFGKPCINGTRISVADVLSWLASGMSFNEILDDYPELNIMQIRAALAFAAHREQVIKIVGA